MLEDSFGVCDSASDLLEYERMVREELESSDPNSMGQRIRVEVMESDEMKIYALDLIVRDQLWENQIDMYGQKLPLYKPATVRKKAKLGFSADKLVNYTYYWTGNFANQGIYIWADAANDRFEFENTYALDYFSYIDEDVIGLTDDNFERFLSMANYMVEQAQYDYFMDKMRERGYDFYF